MVRASRGRVRLLAALLACAVGVAACEVGEAVVPRSEEPLLYLVLGQRTTAGPAQGQYAFLLTAGTALESEYRAAQAFEMTRRSDGARFAWQALPKSGRAPVDASGGALLDANYYLPDVGGPDGAGALEMRPGETYDLRIETHGVVIQGAVTVPDSFEVRVDGRTVAWPRVRGAAGYSVEVRGRTAPAVQADTQLVLPSGTSPGALVVVKALDPQLHAYQLDPQAERSGIDRGYGVFGALTTASIRADGSAAND